MLAWPLGSVAPQQLEGMPDCHPLGRCLTSLAEHWLCSLISSCSTHQSCSAHRGTQMVGHITQQRCRRPSLNCLYGPGVLWLLHNSEGIHMCLWEHYKLPINHLHLLRAYASSQVMQQG